MKIIKKITLLALAFLMILGCVPMLASCGADEAEVLKAFKELYEKSVEVNGIIFGTELEHGEVYGHEGYAKVLDSAKYKSEKEITFLCTKMGVDIKKTPLTMFQISSITNRLNGVLCVTDQNLSKKIDSILQGV